MILVFQKLLACILCGADNVCSKLVTKVLSLEKVWLKSKHTAFHPLFRYFIDIGQSLVK